MSILVVKSFNAPGFADYCDYVIFTKNRIPPGCENSFLSLHHCHQHIVGEFYLLQTLVNKSAVGVPPIK
jgi:hypothetical protein